MTRNFHNGIVVTRPLILTLVALALLTAGTMASANCGPVSPGGKQDSNCQNQTAPPSISYLQDAKNIRDLMKSEQIYFLGKNADSLSLSGEIFWYGDKSCFLIEEKTEMSGSIKAQVSKCSDQIKKRASLSYLRIENFDEFQKKFLSCLKSWDVTCLRSLTSKNIQVSFGVEPPGDQAYLMYSKWKKSDFEVMEKLLQKGTSCHGDKCEFPKTVSDNGTGFRGGFEKNKRNVVITLLFGGRLENRASNQMGSYGETNLYGREYFRFGEMFSDNEGIAATTQFRKLYCDL